MQKDRGGRKVWSSKSRNQSQGASSQNTPIKEDELTKQHNYQQHQIDALVGQVKKLISPVKATQASSKGQGQVVLGGNLKLHGEGVLVEGVCLHRPNPEPLSSQNPEAPRKSRGLASLTGVGNVGMWGI